MFHCMVEIRYKVVVTCSEHVLAYMQFCTYLTGHNASIQGCKPMY